MRGSGGERGGREGKKVRGRRVDEVDRVVGLLASSGVTFNRYDGMDQDSAGVWTTPGEDRVAWFSDPDGNNLSLTKYV